MTADRRLAFSGAEWELRVAGGEGIQGTWL